MNFLEYYKPPFKFLLNSPKFGKILSSNDKMAFDFCENFGAPSYKDKFLRIINGEEKMNIKDINFLGGIEMNFPYITSGRGDILIVRGWGGLIGIGGYDLSAEEAEKIQRDFLKFIFEKLTN